MSWLLCLPSRQWTVPNHGAGASRRQLLRTSQQQCWPFAALPPLRPDGSDRRRRNRALLRWAALPRASFKALCTPQPAVEIPPRGRAGHGAPLSTTDSYNCGPGSLLVGTSPSPPCLSRLPQQPPSQIFPASSKCLFLPEPDTDTINCEQFSRLLCDMEGDEETREAYANIGEKAFLVQKKDN